MNVVREISRQKWSDFVYRHCDGNVFQSPDMYDVYSNTKNYEPIFLAVVGEDDELLGTLLAVIQREYCGLIGDLSARSIVWGGPLIKDTNKRAFNLILDAYNKIVAKKVVYTQIRNLWSFSDAIPLFAQHGYQYTEHLNFVIDLSVGKDKLFSNLSASKRRQIRRAREKENVKIVMTQDEKDIVEFYKVLSTYYSMYIKKPIPPLEFFLHMVHILGQKGLIQFFFVKHDEQIIGGIVCPISRNFSKSTIYELYICGSREHAGLFPSVMATWAPIEWGAENEINEFNFMGAGKPNVMYGVREFKAKFGGRLVNDGRFEKIHQPIKLRVAKLGFRMWQLVKRSER